jgi:ABC-type multidrug transport system fused ATPase/permease subunit
MTTKISKRKTNIQRPDIFGLLGRLLQHISRRRQYQFVLLLGLMLASAFAEVVSLGAVLPFLGILTAPEKVFSYPVVAGIVQAWGIVSAGDLVLPLTVAFAVAALVAGGLRLLMLWASTRLAFAIGADLSTEVYRRTLYQPYHVHVARNSSEIISGIIQKVDVAVAALLSLLALGSSMVLFVAIMLALLAIAPVVAAVAAISFGASYGLIAWLSRHGLVRNSQRISQEQKQVVKALQEGLGGIRDVLLDGTQSAYVDIYRKADQPLRRAQGNNFFIGQSPRFAMEALGMVLIASLAYSLSRQPGGVGTALPVLGALALGAQRLLPVLQQLYVSWTHLAGNRASLTDVLELLDQPLPNDAFRSIPAPLIFQDAICLDGVRFRYRSDSPWVLDGLNLHIPRGARIGFVGSTGSGKSTALDLLMFLLEPTQGRILVDGQPISGERRRAWQRTIAHVPQSIYLADTTLAENIAFGVPPEQVDLDRVRQAAHQAQIAEFIESRPEGYHALVGERGIRLSGGQRQRIGIARALYKQATVLVFDEATSALDNATEQAVMKAIENLNRDLTLLIIAHRLTTVQHCDTIVQLERGRAVAQGTYEELFEHSPSFRRMALVT